MSPKSSMTSACRQSRSYSAHICICQPDPRTDRSSRTPVQLNGVCSCITIAICPAGFAAVFEMMRASKKPAVGHNLSLDLAFTLAAFAQPLPLDWKDYKLLVASWCAGLL